MKTILAVLSCFAVCACGPIDSTFTGMYEGYFQECTGCHTPDGFGRTSDTEQTLDFSTREDAYRTLTTGRASGLVGNQSACNGVSFVGSDYGSSLLAAVLDEEVRTTFDNLSAVGCDQNAISDMTVKAGPVPIGFLSGLAVWIDEGSPDN